MPYRIVVLGAGISGLTCAWALKKKLGAQANILVLEKSDRVGGWIRSFRHEGFLFEQGPRSCRTKGSGIHTLRLIEELGLQEQVIKGNPSAQFRYLYRNQKLQKLPHNLFSLLFSAWMPKLMSALWQDWKTPKSLHSDESIYDFFVRRLGTYAAENFADPLVSGIYAGDIHKLSLKACFPLFHRWEQEQGSLIKGAFGQRKKKGGALMTPFIQKIQRSPLFSFKEGMETLTRKLVQRLEVEIQMHCMPVTLSIQSEGIALSLSNGQIIEADFVFSALPAYALGELLAPYEREFQTSLQGMAHASVCVVNLGYKKRVLKQAGFGYLIPHQENEEILGCVWDSSVFPEQNQGEEETRLTIMIGINKRTKVYLSEGEYLSIALNAVARHLDIHSPPHTAVVNLAQNAIPQYEVGYSACIQQIEQRLSRLTPYLIPLGAAFHGVSVNDCIANAYQKVEQLF